MSEMIDRIAKLFECDDRISPFMAERMAREAIEAMREPTDAMCEAADWHQQSDVNGYQRAIDAALGKVDA